MMLRRLIDVLGSGILLLPAAPLFLIAALAIWLTDRGPVFYRQTRAGLRGCPFELLKFRSMQVNNLPAVVVGQVSEEHPMVTPVGRWIRRFKIDELPQLLNVFCGEMTLIGPRPTVLEQVEAYTVFQRRRLDIPPGMTGWAQVNGGVELSWPERIMLDVWYIDHRSFWLDMTILWRTAAVVLFGDKPNGEALNEAITYAHQQAGATEVERRQPSLLPPGVNADGVFLPE
ncbi:MAG TPA: sugar transferase [Terriglobales bacterium]|jgi:lipopolysaccharide/colanic/teichoic acid biosynthesis glycosyltransferase|nr:sugar transferase [Terriglobales bacterium]